MDKALSVALVVSILFSGGVLAYVVTTPRPGERFTEFYILGPEGLAEGYPTELNVSEVGTVLLGVANHEFETVDYTIHVERRGVEVVWNATGGYNETRVLNRTTLDWFNLTLEHGTNWTRPYAFSIDAPSQWQVAFLLYRDGELDAVYPYRNLHLFVRVEAG